MHSTDIGNDGYYTRKLDDAQTLEPLRPLNISLVHAPRMFSAERTSSISRNILGYEQRLSALILSASQPYGMCSILMEHKRVYESEAYDV
jgi:hypothetical protein